MRADIHRSATTRSSPTATRSPSCRRPRASTGAACPDSTPGSTFGRILDWERGGYCSIRPTSAHESQRAYVDDTLVLETTFRTRGGEARLDRLLRDAQGRAARTPAAAAAGARSDAGPDALRGRGLRPFDYGEVRPWVRRHDQGLFTAIGGNDAICVQCDHELERRDEHDIGGFVVIDAGDRLRLAISSFPPEAVDVSVPDRDSPAEIDRRLRETIAWWHADARDRAQRRARSRERASLGDRPQGPDVRTDGCVAAAATTSLPERIGGPRNWDYRFSWIRDSHFTVRSLAEIGAESEADGFRRFVERSAAGSAECLQIMYGVGGERRLTEIELDLDGYRGSRPVRIGNGAAKQQQFDVYGELLDLAWQWHERGHSPDDDYWRFLSSLVDRAAEIWKQPDQGMWEMRGKPRHFVQSKAMCWVALERGLQLAREGTRRTDAQVARGARRAARDHRAARLQQADRNVRAGVRLDRARRVVAAAPRVRLRRVGRRADGAHRRRDRRAPRARRDGAALRDDRRSRRRRGAVRRVHVLVRGVSRAPGSPRRGARHSSGPSPRATTSVCSPRSSTPRPARCSATSRRA